MEEDAAADRPSIAALVISKARGGIVPTPLGSKKYPACGIQERKRDDAGSDRDGH